ncbi:MAG: efflux RND transporter permease subunit [Thermoguttaceae bacterium]
MTSQQDAAKVRRSFSPIMRWLIILTFPGLLAFLAWSSDMARRNAANQVLDWLPDGIEETKRFFDYYAQFPEGELLMISWQGSSASDDWLDQIAKQLLAPVSAEQPAYFERVLDTRNAIDDLMSDPLNLTRREARKRLRGWLIGRNDELGCLVAIVSEAGLENRGAAVEAAYQTVEEIVGCNRNDIYIAGPTIDSVAIDRISAASQQRLIPIFLGVCFALLFLCFRNFFAAIIVFLIALINEELGLALLYWSGTHADSISTLISSLVYVLTISTGVHFVNYYRESLRDTSPELAPMMTVKKALFPCSLAVITTVLGLGSLAMSQMIPIRHFGIFASLALIIGTCYLFVFLPAVLKQFPIRSWYHFGTSDTEMKTTDRFWLGWGEMIQRHNTLITILTVLILIACGYGLSRLQTTVTFHGMFLDSARVIQDYNTLEEQIGGLIPIEIVIRLPKSENEETTILDQLYFVREVQNYVGETPGIDTVISALNFSPTLPNRTDKTVRASAQRRALTTVLSLRLDKLKETRFFNETDDADRVSGEMLWRLSLRVQARQNHDYAELLNDLKYRLQQIGEIPESTLVKNVRFDVTGGIPLVHQAQNQLLSDLIDSFFMAFALIAVLMFIILRSFTRGLIAMIPNIFPCVIVFGLMGWIRKPVDMGTMMTASVAMGIAIDGTLHFITWFQTGLKRGMERANAVHFALKQCATALTQTTIICGLGMLVFGWSDFVPVSQFAIVICLLLFVALVGDIVVFPALLYGPIGRIFESPNQRNEANNAPKMVDEN